MPFRWLFDRLGILKTLGLLVLVIWLLMRGSAVLSPRINGADGESLAIVKTGNSIILHTVNFLDEMITNFTGQNVPVCQPRHYYVETNETGPPGPKSENKYELLTKELIYQVDKVHGGNMAMAAKRVLDEWNYPVIVLPYMTEETAQYRKTSDVMILRMPHLFQQNCGGDAVNRTAGFKTVDRIHIHESRFDWD